MYEDDEDQFFYFMLHCFFFLTFSLLIGVLSILDAATNNLVLLINNVLYDIILPPSERVGQKLINNTREVIGKHPMYKDGVLH